MDFFGTTFAILIGLMILIPTLKFVGGIIGFVISWIARICMQIYYMISGRESDMKWDYKDSLITLAIVLWIALLIIVVSYS